MFFLNCILRTASNTHLDSVISQNFTKMTFDEDDDDNDDDDTFVFNA